MDDHWEGGCLGPLIHQRRGECKLPTAATRWQASNNFPIVIVHTRQEQNTSTKSGEVKLTAVHLKLGEY